MLSDEGLRLDVVAHNYFFEIGDRIEFIKEVIQADPDRPPNWKTKQVKPGQLRAELSRTQMAGCESPLANVIHSVIHCVISKGDSMVFTDTVLEAGAPQRVRSRLKIEAPSLCL